MRKTLIRAAFHLLIISCMSACAGELVLEGGGELSVDDDADNMDDDSGTATAAALFERDVKSAIIERGCDNCHTQTDCDLDAESQCFLGGAGATGFYSALTAWTPSVVSNNKFLTQGVHEEDRTDKIARAFCNGVNSTLSGPDPTCTEANQGQYTLIQAWLNKENNR